MGPPCTSTPNRRKHFFPLPLAFVSGQRIRIRALNERGDIALKSDGQRQDSVIHWGIGWGGQVTWEVYPNQFVLVPPSLPIPVIAPPLFVTLSLWAVAQCL